MSGVNMGRDVVLGEEVMETAAIRTVVLASADAGFITGEVISVSGGLTMHG